MTTRRILDIDFDFFVRESPIWLWDHAEMYAPKLLDIVWQNRVLAAINGDVNLHDRMLPKDDPAPSEFWNELSRLGWYPALDLCLYYAYSHGTIGVLLHQWMLSQISRHGEDTEFEIIHIDAHHDVFYSHHQMGVQAYFEKMRQGYVSCENWILFLAIQDAFMGKLKRVRVIYPNWRKEVLRADVSGEGVKEFKFEEITEKQREVIRMIMAGAGVEIKFEHWSDFASEYAEAGDSIDVITSCLSPAWSPPWRDIEYQQFITSAPVLPMDTKFIPWGHGDRDFDSGDAESFTVRQWPQTWSGVLEQYGPMADQWRRGKEMYDVLHAAMEMGTGKELPRPMK